MANFDSVVLGGGCFWCIEEIYNELKGVIEAISGYAGGHVDNPSYKAVCDGTTGHAEVVKVDFDPEVISLREILEVFFVFHDPTTLNRQGNDVGTQYRSVVYFKDKEQEKLTKQIISEFTEKKIWSNPIVTQVESLDKFFRAEEYHQRYFKRNPGQGYCQIVIAPKVSKFRKKYYEKLKETEK